MAKKLRDKLRKHGVLLNEPAVMLGAQGGVKGRLILTPLKLFFAPNGVSTEEDRTYFIGDQDLSDTLEIDLDTINQLRREEDHVDPNILAIMYLQYDEARFSVLHFKEWEDAIEKARMAPDIPGDPNKEPKI